MAQANPKTSRRSQPKEDDLGIVDALAQLSFLVQSTLAKHAAAVDLSMIQARMLGVLRDREPTMQELAGVLELDKSSVTGLVDRAEKRHLVERYPSSADRRSVRVRLTMLGRQAVQEVSDDFKIDIARFTADLSPADLVKLSTLATKVVHGRTPGEVAGIGDHPLP